MNRTFVVGFADNKVQTYLHLEKKNSNVFEFETHPEKVCPKEKN